MGTEATVVGGGGNGQRGNMICRAGQRVRWLGQSSPPPPAIPPQRPYSLMCLLVALISHCFLFVSFSNWWFPYIVSIAWGSFGACPVRTECCPRRWRFFCERQGVCGLSEFRSEEGVRKHRVFQRWSAEPYRVRHFPSLSLYSCRCNALL